jgi:hypothetical protein
MSAFHSLSRHAFIYPLTYFDSADQATHSWTTPAMDGLKEMRDPLREGQGITKYMTAHN